MKKYICMIVYTHYLVDNRVMREAETLAALPGYDVTVLSLKRDASPETYVEKRVNIKELNVQKYRGKSNSKYIVSYFKFILLAFFECTRLLFNRSLDVVHVHNMPNYLIFAAIIPRLLGKKIVLDMHDAVPEMYYVKFKKKSNLLFRFLCWEELLCCRFAHKVICVNEVQKEISINRGVPERKITISMNVPDPSKLEQYKRIEHPKKSNENYSIVYHGTLAKRLGIDLTIRAVAKLIEKIPEINFYIYGGGDDSDEFIELSRELGIRDRIHLREYVPLEDLMDVLSRMNLGVVSNRRNIATELMLPVKMLEYVALGIPVVAPRLKAIQHYFSDEMVTYFEPGSVDSLADAILGMYRDESKCKKQTEMALKFIEEYGWEKHGKEFIQLYKEL